MILLRGFLSSGTEGSGLELWLADSKSLPAPAPKVALLILTGGAGGLSSGSPLSHILARRYGSRRAWGCAAVEDGQGGRQKGAQGGAHVNTSWSSGHTPQEEEAKMTVDREIVQVAPVKKLYPKSQRIGINMNAY